MIPIDGRFIVVKCDFNLCFCSFFFGQSLLDKHKEFSEKLEEVCDSLTLTENRLIGHQQQGGNAECVADLQQYQQEHQV